MVQRLIPKSLMLSNKISLLRFIWFVNVAWVHNKLFSIFVFLFSKIRPFYFWTQIRICLFILENIFTVWYKRTIQVYWEEELESFLSLALYKNDSLSLCRTWLSVALVWVMCRWCTFYSKALATHLNDIKIQKPTLLNRKGIIVCISRWFIFFD